jgi:transcriptional regulator with XRE-family HTH domain
MSPKPSALDALRGNIVFRRAERGLSQSELAKRANVARQTISKVESGDGNVTIAVLEKIAAVLGCSVKDLFESSFSPVDDAELERRAKAPASEFVNARRLLAAIDEANEVRYSRAGRPKAVGRRTAQKRR